MRRTLLAGVALLALVAPALAVDITFNSGAGSFANNFGFAATGAIGLSAATATTTNATVSQGTGASGGNVFAVATPIGGLAVTPNAAAVGTATTTSGSGSTVNSGSALIGASGGIAGGTTSGGASGFGSVTTTP